MRILVVDSDQYTLDLLTYLLMREGHSVVTARDGQQALAYWRVGGLDLLISEMDLPKLSGYELCEIVRTSGSTPFIFLSERQSENDILKGFEAGADDYLPKPFSPRILVARIQAVARRPAAPKEEEEEVRERLEVGDLTLDPGLLEVAGPRGEVRLPPAEFEILHVLALHKGAVLTAEKIVELVWGPEGREKRGLVKTHIHHLRQKIEVDPNNPRYLLTVPGVGYTLSALRSSPPKEAGEQEVGKRFSLLRSSSEGG